MPMKIWEASDLPTALMVVAPHPDDEVLDCARLTRRVATEGGSVVIAWVTDSGASHGQLVVGERAALTARRQVEAKEGLAELGIAPMAIVFLGYPDGSLETVDPDQPARRLRALCDDHAIDVGAVTDGDDGRGDQRAAFAIARCLKVARLFAYPISSIYNRQSYTPPKGALPFASYPGDCRRAAALRCHRSHCVEGGARFPLFAAAIKRLRAAPEIFVPVLAS